MFWLPLADLFLDHQMLVYAYELLKRTAETNAGRGGHKGTDNRIREIFIEGVWTSIRYVLLCVSMMMHMQQRRSGTSGG